MMAGGKEMPADYVNYIRVMAITFEQLKPVSQAAVREAMGKSFGRDYLAKSSVQPYLVYWLLKQHFGEPNGKAPLDEKKIQWEWLFNYKEFFIEIYDWRYTSVSIGVYHVNSDYEQCVKIGEELEQVIEKAASQKKHLLKDRTKQAKHKILTNPFVVYCTTALELMDVVEAIEKDEMHGSHDLNMDDLAERKSSLCRAAFLQLLSAAEGFLNMLHELYLKPALRHERLSERIAREQVDVKLRMLPVYCDGFKVQTIDGNDERFKAYHRLIALRNNFIHANLTKSLERYIVKEDNCNFVIEHEEDSEIPTDIRLLERKHVLVAQKVINDVVELVLESMQPKLRREFEMLITEAEIEVEEVDDILIPTVFDP